MRDNHSGGSGQPVKKVQSVNGPDQDPSIEQKEPVSGKSGFGPINAIRNGLSDLIGGGAAAIKSGLQGLIGSGFGAKAAGKGIVSGITAIGNFLHISPAAAGIGMALAV